MSYIVYTSSGTVLTTIPTGKIDTGTTSITLIGRDVINYGRYYNQNLVNILSNFANSSANPPSSPITGQLWYDMSSKRLKVYDTEFQTIGIATISSTQPIGQDPGGFWYDSNNSSLNFLDDNGHYNTVASFSSSTFISKTELKAIVAASGNWGEFQTNIANL